MNFFCTPSGRRRRCTAVPCGAWLRGRFWRWNRIAEKQYKNSAFIERINFQLRRTQKSAVQWSTDMMVSWFAGNSLLKTVNVLLMSRFIITYKYNSYFKVTIKVTIIKRGKCHKSVLCYYVAHDLSNRSHQKRF